MELQPNVSAMIAVVSLATTLLIAAAAGRPSEPGPLGGPEPAVALEPSIKRASADRGRIFADRCIVLGRETRSPKCVYGQRRADTTVVLLGDSHALQWGPTMIRLARERGWRLVALIRQGCTVAQVRFESVCDGWRRNTMKRIIQREKPGLVVVSTATTWRYTVKRGGRTLSREASQPDLRRGMQKTLRRLRDSGARTVLIRDQDRAPSPPPKCLRRRSAKRCAFRPDGRRAEQGFDYAAARNVKGVRTIDPRPKLCPKRHCRVVVGGKLVYRDSYHLTATFAESLAPWLGGKLPKPRRR